MRRLVVSAGHPDPAGTAAPARRPSDAAGAAMTAPPARAPATGRLPRVTLVGPRRRADLVLPSDEPIGMLLPEIVTMVGLGPAGDPRGYQVSTLDGQVLEPIVNLRAAGVADGAVLRVDP